MMQKTSMGARLMARLDHYAAFSDDEGALTRLYLSPSHRRLVDTILADMQRIGLDGWCDATGNIQARYEGTHPEAPALLIGSHIDTVRNAGRFDGTLGSFAALTLVEELMIQKERLPFPIEIVMFGDEEGVRFPTTLGGSKALAGTFDIDALEKRDSDGVRLRDALVGFGCDPDAIAALARDSGSVRGYLELHIEQGPVLEAKGLPVGVVTAINGATRFFVTLRGMAGHAGTVPMPGRADSLACAAEMILAVERIGGLQPDLVATVGQIVAKPGAVNVIAGETRFSVDVRAPQDTVRHKAAATIQAELAAIAARRRIGLDIVPVHDSPAVACDENLQAILARAVAAEGIAAHHLPSGAGHDAMALSSLCPVAMLFVRCKGGISHNPAESMTLADAEVAMNVLKRSVQALAVQSS
jgi:allantoate deiminase